MSKTQTVYPNEGTYLNDVPHVEHECSDQRCVESGAFTPDKPKAAKGPADAGPSDSKTEE